VSIAIRPAPVRKSLFVRCRPARAFEVFTAGMGGWWLKTHSLTKSGQAGVTIEPRAGGRWYETGRDGETCDWGRVEAWEPPHRVLLIWTLNADFTTDPPVPTEVEVTFAAEGEGTRVTLEHRGLEAHGARGEETRGVLDSGNGWGGLLAAFAGAAADAA